MLTQSTKIILICISNPQKCWRVFDNDAYASVQIFVLQPTFLSPSCTQNLFACFSPPIYLNSESIGFSGSIFILLTMNWSNGHLSLTTDSAIMWDKQLVKNCREIDDHWLVIQEIIRWADQWYMTKKDAETGVKLQTKKI